MTPIVKKYLSRSLILFCNALPVTKPVLRRYGMRATKWLPVRPVNVQFAEGTVLRLTNININYLTFHLFWVGGDHYEPITRRVIDQLISSEHTFLDIGANIGFFSLVVAKSHPNIKKIIAFEPHPKLVSIINANIQANTFKTITCEPLALSDQEGEALLYLSKSDMSASLNSDFDHDKSPPVLVKCTTLDKYIQSKSLSGPFLLKVDVEGHENAFFRGAVDTIAKFKPDLICEVAIRYKSNPFLFLKDYGYHFYQITNRGLHLSDRVVPIIEGHFFFPNYLMSTRPPGEIAGLFERIRPSVEAIDLTKTSKYFGQDSYPEAREEE